MSDALDYLVKTRPDAMGPYLKFMKEAGRHLDPKTRDLISVITKVHSRTERGFRQYLLRALRNGCSPQEVIDALLMAFPALGLARILWAVDLLLEMDIPEFRPENLGQPPRWRDVAAADGLPEGEVSFLETDGRHLYIHRAGNEYRVYDSRCPHQVTDIPHLALEGHRLTCPKHQWAFDVTTGECVAKGKRPLRRFECRVENGRLQVCW